MGKKRKLESFVVLPRKEGALDLFFPKSATAPQGRANGSRICPYTPLLPVCYLMFGPQYLPFHRSCIADLSSGGIWDRANYRATASGHGRANPGHAAKTAFGQAYVAKPIGMIMAQYYAQSPGTIRSYISDYLKYDEPVYISGGSLRVQERMAIIFKGTAEQTVCNIYSQAFTGEIAPYYITLRGVVMATACILPENLLYQKMHFLLHGKLDPTRILMLVASELDDPDFPNVAFRRFFHRHIKPSIDMCPYTVMKVPSWFIDQNTTLPEVVKKTRNVIEKKKISQEVIKTFIKFAAEQADPDPLAASAAIASNVVTTGDVSQSLIDALVEANRMANVLTGRRGAQVPSVEFDNGGIHYDEDGPYDEDDFSSEDEEEEASAEELREYQRAERERLLGREGREAARERAGLRQVLGVASVDEYMETMGSSGDTELDQAMREALELTRLINQ